MPTLRLLAALALSMTIAGAGAHDFKAAGLTIDHPWARATVPGAKVGGAFLTIKNEGASADRLVGVSVPFAAKAEIHESLEEDGVAKMRPVEGGVGVKPGETVELAPGGKHLMFIGLKEPLTKGAKVKGALTFEKAGTVDVEFAIEAAGAKPASHGEHDKHGM